MKQQQQQNNHHPHSRSHTRSGSHSSEVLWPRLVIRKWLNRSSRTSEYNADSDDDTAYGTDGDEESSDWPKELRFKDNKQGDDLQSDTSGAVPRPRRRKSETFRAQYIDAKELKVSVSTWNVAGKLPPEDLDIKDWLDVDNPADIYVIGFQEIIPLNAGNIFGAESNRPVPVWENIIRETLNKIPSEKTKFKYYSNPPSPSRFKPSDDVPDIEDVVVLETDSECEEEIHPFNEESNFDDLMDGPAGQNRSLSTVVSMEVVGDSEKRYSSQKTLDRVNCFSVEESEGTVKENINDSVSGNSKKLARLFSGTERIGLSWPEPPLDLLAQCVSAPERPSPLQTVKSFKASKSFKTYASFKSYVNVDNRVMPEELFLPDLNLDSTLYRKRRPAYVRIVSKQMVGVFITIWVRRQLRKHIQNVHVSAVGVGVMGYIGNKGSISVSMSIYQTLFCFICTHLTSGEKDADAIKRNADVHEIRKRTRFNSFLNSTLPRRIENHDRIIWLGDLNYRLNLSYEKTCDLISQNEWSKLLECDQLLRELRKGRAFDGWSEGVLDFPPTYKYERNSDKYVGADPKVGRRTPAWCDRILSYGKGIRQLGYRRSEIRFSDHRPVSASYMIEVEVFSPRKLQKALTFTDAEIENDDEMAIVDAGINCLRLIPEEAASLSLRIKVRIYWNRVDDVVLESEPLHLLSSYVILNVSEVYIYTS
ncbi:type IV inositol polyphosphate 5-phosphatase 3 isoform X2 [Helianthus annuus]|uniref:type IV inositol polyphosphate 5-phosphatase 3 isoform X2 n=1 Tax=Helianthus annuus TaxID=4232 RepID=UPI000B8FAAE0|nr:type IV inositol polyphosphate 5-phosphatase 3 isoform X2 [Helianthus annuus]XP_035835353.1 type IV inositol polyphosphate 5-phosphatase 3 isoform X2 [Helianthus annuus]